MKYNVQIKAQIQWATEVEADSPDAAEEKAQEEFEMSQATNSTHVEAINWIDADEVKE